MGESDALLLVKISRLQCHSNKQIKGLAEQPRRFTVSSSKFVTGLKKKIWILSDFILQHKIHAYFQHN